MQKYTYICWIHTDAMITDARNDKDAMIMTDVMNKDAGRILYKNIYLSLYL